MGKKWIALLGILVSLISSVAIAQSNGTGSGSGSGNAITVGTSNGVVVTPPNTVNASNDIIVQAENVVISHVGSAYFDNYINYTGGQTYLYNNGTNITQLHFSYAMPFANGTTVSASQQLGGLVASVGVSVVYSNGALQTYYGPTHGYVITVTKQQAISDAAAYGLANASTASISVASPEGYMHGTSGYSVVWAVLSGSKNSNNVYLGVYVDSETGNALGQYYYNPEILTASSSQGGTTGNFSLFTPQPSTSSPSSSSSSTTTAQNGTQPGTTPPAALANSEALYLGIIIAVIIIIAGAISIQRRGRQLKT